MCHSLNCYSEDKTINRRDKFPALITDGLCVRVGKATKPKSGRIFKAMEILPSVFWKCKPSPSQLIT